MRLIWSKTAARDLEELAVYIARDSEQAAQLVENRIHEAAKLLLRIPDSGRQAEWPVLASWLLPEPLTSSSIGIIHDRFEFYAYITAPAAGRQASTRNKQSRFALQSPHAALV